MLEFFLEMRLAMSSVLDSIYTKEKCQKFTSPDLVKTILDMADYSHGVIGKRVLENSFGSGNFLKGIVERYIKDGFAQNLSPSAIAEQMSTDIIGVELDTTLFDKTIEELNHFVAECGLPPVMWSLYNDDFLGLNFVQEFDYIIGNPPYISYRDIDEESRKQIREKFSTCKVGKFDYCYAFIEKSIGLLSPSGSLVQLVPSNIYKNVYANELRSLLLRHLTIVWEYPQKKMFGETLTSSSLFMYNKAYSSNFVEYKNVTENTSVQIPREKLTGKWVFRSEECSYSGVKLKRFGDYYNASITVATLLNEAFLLKDAESISKIETQVIRPAASPRARHEGKKEYIIFPYYYCDDVIHHFECEAFEKEYPCASQHLKSFKEKLDLRDKDKNAKWFEYGRSQALSHLNQRKLLLSTVITNKVELYLLDSETIPYSGIYITTKNINEKYSLEYAKTLLESERFMEYVRSLGISISGKSKRITCKDINNYCFVEEDEHGAIAVCN